jgi:hypothetical protein
MAYAFDTLGYSKTLRAAGIPTDHAEAHAEAAREFIMVDLPPRRICVPPSSYRPCRSPCAWVASSGPSLRPSAPFSS